MEQEFASSLLENAVSEFAKLPGIGRKTALRLVLHLLKQDKQNARQFGEAIIKLRRKFNTAKCATTSAKPRFAPSAPTSCVMPPPSVWWRM